MRTKRPKLDKMKLEKFIYLFLFFFRNQTGIWISWYRKGWTFPAPPPLSTHLLSHPFYLSLNLILIYLSFFLFSLTQVLCLTFLNLERWENFLVLFWLFFFFFSRVKGKRRQWDQSATRRIRKHLNKFE